MTMIKIHHCLPSLESDGGVESYLKMLINAQPAGISNQVISSLKDHDQSRYKLLHVHGRHLLWELRGECPAVYTAHNHSAYCPSGTKFLSNSGSACARQKSVFGCLRGYLIDGCGSRRPENILKGFQGSHGDLEILKRLNMTAIAVSDYVRNQLLTHGLSPEQVVTVRNGIKMPQKSHTPLTKEIHQNRRILFVGRIVPYKGLEWLLKSLTMTDSCIHLDIAGDGWDKTRMEQLAIKLGIRNRITWHGWCNSEKIDLLYEQCFALVFPSLWPEPAGLVTLEAYARHRPVIASRLGGIPEHVLHKETGILVSANETKELALAITELADNYLIARKLSEQGYVYLLDNFTLEHHIQKLQVVYEKAIQRFHSSAHPFPYRLT
jgi:glycosyltransferase involved in cell wall biosynthesis